MPRTDDIPAALRHEVRRRRLFARLGGALEGRITLVTGPVGSGKTTAVAQWARTLSDRVIWFDLDDRDDDPGRLRKRVLERFDLDARVFDADEVDDDWVRRLDGRIHDTVVVCDGVDVIDDPVTGGDLDSLCSRGPAGLHVVLVGRSLPALPSLTRLRLAGELHEVLPDDLRCRDDEAAEILAAFGVPAAAGEQHDLVARTEGLVAAIALTGVLGRAGHGGFADFGGDTPEMAEYLYTEVISRLNVDVFGFMLATSVFNDLEAAACNEVTGRADSAALLADLARRNVLTIAVDHGERYRYHPLLLTFLRSELRRTQPERWRALHRSAASYYERRGDEDLALHHWVEAGEAEEAWSRFRRRALPRFFDGAVTSVAQWTELLPAPEVPFDARTGLDMALTLLYMGDVDGAAEWCDLVDTQLPRDGVASVDVRAQREYLRFLLDFAQGDLLKAARQGRVARELIERSDLTLTWDELRAPCAHAQLQSLIGRPGRARITMEEFIARENPHHATDRVAIPGTFAQIAITEGALTEALEQADLSLSGVDRISDKEFWFTITPLYARGLVHYERNALEDARDDFERACALSGRQGYVHASLLPLLALARVSYTARERAAAHELLEQARRVVRRRDALPLMQSIDEIEAMFAINDGEFEHAVAVLERLHEPFRSRVQARLHAELGEHARVGELLDRFPDVSIRDRIEVLLLRARGDDDNAVELVRQALTIGEREGYVRVFVDEAGWVAPYVRQLVGSWPTQYAAEVAAAILAEPDRRPSARNLAELSEREQEVWRFLSTSLSMQEIADALYVSRNTLKSHVRSIYRKLGVSTREAAVGHAHPLRRSEF